MSSSVSIRNFPAPSGRGGAGFFNTAMSLSAASSSMMILLSNVDVAIGDTPFGTPVVNAYL
jgi:hypothetical protein